MIRVGGTYRFVQQDCAGMHVPGMAEVNGSTVRVIEAYDCLSCWWVRCVASGREFQVFEDELQPIEGCGEHDPLFAPGDAAVAMVSIGSVLKGHRYIVQTINRRGMIIVARASYATQVLTGEYDPSCFRRE